MFDDDRSFLTKFIDEFRKHKFEIYYPDEYSFMGILRGNEDTVVVICKTKHVPFYRVYLIRMETSNINFINEWKNNTLLSFVYANQHRVKEFHVDCFSGHLVMERIVLQVLKDRYGISSHNV